MLHPLAPWAVASVILSAAPPGAPPLAVAPDSPRWELEGQARPVTLRGRRCLLLDGGAAVLKDLELRDGVIDVDVSTSAARGFLGLQFRVSPDGADGEVVYLRPHRSGYPDALQYTPVLHTGLNWQLYNGQGFTAPVAIPRDTWLHLRLEVAGAQARLFVQDLARPALVVEDLKSGRQSGLVALWVLGGATCYANLQIRPTPPVPFERHPPPMPPGTLTRWSLSPAFDALARDLERPLSTAEVAAMPWEEVEAEPPGLVPINRYRQSPHPRVSFASDFSRRLEPQPGMAVVYARTRLDADRDQLARLSLGYSDEVSVFLDGRLLYRGRSAQNFRDPGFLGIVNAENDALYLPLTRGPHELVLAVAELGGGWGFVARLEALGDPAAPR